MRDNVYIDVYCKQINHVGELICGDVFLSKRIKEENRTIVVLSDGMGSGVKANVLATLTATMAVNFTLEHKEVKKTAEIIMNTLPVCSVRQVSYSTFTIVDIDHKGFTRIVEYDNPKCVIMRGIKEIDPNWEEVEIETDNAGKIIRVCEFSAQKEDRIIFCSDGIVQSGMGSRQFPFGWEYSGYLNYVVDKVGHQPYVSARKLSNMVVNKAVLNDDSSSKDDTSCGVIYFREPRKLLLCTGPPFDPKRDMELAVRVQQFKGKKILCGGTTSEIIARELGLKFSAGMDITDPELPPISYVEGINLVTEGILTIGKVVRILEDYDSNTILGEGPADQIVTHFIKSDYITIIIGTKINIAHQDPSLPVELEIRRNVIKRIVKLLEEKFLKDVNVTYL